MMKETAFLFIIFSFFISSCDMKKMETNLKENSRLQWVNLHMDVVMKSDTTSYYYYGQISQNDIDQLQNQPKKGMFTLRNIRYFNTENQLEIYEDNNYAGKMLFNYKDVSWVELLKKDPILIFDSLQLGRTSQKFLSLKRNSENKN